MKTWGEIITVMRESVVMTNNANILLLTAVLLNNANALTDIFLVTKLSDEC
jgi:hypothetical protein